MHRRQLPSPRALHPQDPLQRRPQEHRRQLQSPRALHPRDPLHRDPVQQRRRLQPFRRRLFHLNHPPARVHPTPGRRRHYTSVGGKLDRQHNMSLSILV